MATENGHVMMPTAENWTFSVSGRAIKTGRRFILALGWWTDEGWERAAGRRHD
jgi:hypothetical protein